MRPVQCPAGRHISWHEYLNANQEDRYANDQTTHLRRPKHLARKNYSRSAPDRDPAAVHPGSIRHRAYLEFYDIRRAEGSARASRQQGVVMTAPTPPLKRRAAWKKLQGHFKVIGARHLRELFAEDPDRGEQLTLEAAGIYLDYSKHRITRATLQLLVELAEESGLRERINAMFAGEPINVSEQRSVLHVALRAPGDASIQVGGRNVVPAVQAVLGKMGAFAAKVRSGAWLGYTNRPITNVVNIGIGGSDLGPVMAYEALKAYSKRDMTFRFVSNVDGTDFVRLEE